MSTTFSNGWSESGNGQDPFSLAVFNGNLYFFGQYGQYSLNSISLKYLQSDATLPVTPSVYSKALTVKNFAINSKYTRITSDSPSSSAMAVIGDPSAPESTLCLFWNDSRAGIVAAITNSSNINSSQIPWYTLQDVSGVALGQNDYDITATVLDNPKDITSSFIFIATLRGSGSNRNIYIGCYQLTNLIEAQSGSFEPGTWNAIMEWSITYDQLLGNPQNNISTSNIDTSLHMEWYSMSVPSTPTDPPSSWLGITLFDPSLGQGYVCWLTLDFASMPIILIGGSSSGNPIKTAGQPFTIPSICTPLNIKRSLGGSVRIYAANPAVGNVPSSLTIYTQPGNQAPIAPQVSNTFSPCLLANGQNVMFDGILPVPAFLVGNNQIPTVVLNDPLNQGILSASPVSETIFVHTDNAMNYYSQSFGRVQQVPTVTMGTTSFSNIIAIQGVFDGPFPMPGAQLVPYFGTQTSFANVIYGTTDLSTTSRSMYTGISLGIRSSQTVTKGIGPSWEASMTTGFGTEVRTTKSTTLINNVKQEMALDANQNVVAKGTVFGTGMAFFADVYRLLVLDPAGSGFYIVAPNACLWATIWAGPVGQQSLLYNPFAVTPGDITSYTEEAWNAKMNSLGYPGWNYFNDVVVANAYTFPTLSTPYVEIPLAVASSPSIEVDLMNSDFKEFDWNFDLSVYAGISGEGGIDIFGLGEEMQWSVMAGFTTSIHSKNTVDKETSWGIAFSDIYFPAPQVGTMGVVSFTVRIYLLPASHMWTEELIALGNLLNTGTTIDPNSHPWRIVYQVTSYTLTDGTTTIQYPPSTPPSPPTSAPTLNLTTMEWETITSSVWSQSSATVSYAVAFANARGISKMGSWTNAVSIPGTGACPQLIIPVDSSNPVLTTMRLVYRIISNGQQQLVKTIPDNLQSSSTFYDDDPSVNFQPPATLSIDPDSNWKGRSNNESKVWLSGNSVSYSVSFTFQLANNLPASWAQESMLSNSSAPATINLNAFATISNIPTFPTGTNLPVCSGRNIYRTVVLPDGSTLEDNVYIGHISDNTTTTFTDMKG